MRFFIESTVWDEGNEILDKYPWLSEYGYENRHITVNTLEDLMTIANKIQEGDGLIVFPNHDVYDRKKRKWVLANEPKIEIYDGYRE